jgi:hypothetical protein
MVLGFRELRLSGSCRLLVNKIRLVGWCSGFMVLGFWEFRVSGFSTRRAAAEQGEAGMGV